MTNKLEGSFTGKLLAQYRAQNPRAIVYKVADRMTLGIPDTVITLDGYTSWWEMKVVRTEKDWNLKGLGKGIQHNACMKLAKEGVCWYVVFVDQSYDKRILLVEPRDIHIASPIHEVEGHNYKEFAKYMVLEHTGFNATRER